MAWTAVLALAVALIAAGYAAGGWRIVWMLPLAAAVIALGFDLVRAVGLFGQERQHDEYPLSPFVALAGLGVAFLLALGVAARARREAAQRRNSAA